jgi:hypothetical protein
MVFDNRLPNVVAFGDSNEAVFGPALQLYLSKARSFETEQIVVKFRGSSRPRNWLLASDRLHDANFGELWRTGDTPSSGPPIEEALSLATVLVEIGLGGNLLSTPKDRKSIGALVRQVLSYAPLAQIVWRGLPPATASSDGAVAERSIKLGRYQKNAILKQELMRLGLGFSVVGPVSTSASGLRRAYLDLIALHAGGPADGAEVGSPGARNYEREVLDTSEPDRVAGEQPAAGPWNEFQRGRDGMPVHVPSKAAHALLEKHVGPLGLFPFRPTAPSKSHLAEVIDPDARVRGGPPEFVWRKPEVIPRGKVVEVVEGQRGFGRVVGFGRSECWTKLSNLSFREAPSG